MCRQQNPNLSQLAVERSVLTAVVSAVAILAGVAQASADARPILVVRPAVVIPGAAAVVSVSGIEAASVEARVGRTRWRPLVRNSAGWRGLLPGPTLRGVYTVELRSRGKVYRADAWLLRVLARRTLARPSFDVPKAVAAWWAQTVPRPRSRLVAIRRWPLPAGDRRDPRLHRLFVIAYSPIGDRTAAHRLGIWITAFRNGYSGRWRLLEATVQPPGPWRRRPHPSKPVA